MSDKKYIINKTKSILIVQDNNNKTICTLKPFTVSYEPYETSTLKHCRHIQSLLLSDYIELSDTNEVEFNEFGKDHGQFWKIGTVAQLKGDAGIKIQILAYSPTTKKYKVRIVKSGGTLVVTEKEIVELEQALEDEFDNQQVEIVDNDGAQETDESVEELSGEEALRMLEKSAQSISQEDVEINFHEEGTTTPEEDEFEEQLIVKKEGAKFAEEVTLARVAKDTSKEVTKKLTSALTKVAETSNTSKKTKDLDQIPEKYQEWFQNFLQKDDRKKKMTISSCNDIAKLNIIIQFGDETSVKLAQTKLSKIAK